MQTYLKTHLWRFFFTISVVSFLVGSLATWTNLSNPLTKPAQSNEQPIHLASSLETSTGQQAVPEQQVRTIYPEAIATGEKPTQSVVVINNPTEIPADETRGTAEVVTTTTRTVTTETTTSTSQPPTIPTQTPSPKPAVVFSKTAKVLEFHGDSINGSNSKSDVVLAIEGENSLEVNKTHIGINSSVTKENLTAGTTVTVEGTYQNGSFSVTDIKPASSTTGTPRFETVTNADIAVIPFKFQNTTQTNPYREPTNLRGILFDNSDSVKNYYFENSFGKLTMSGAVFNWVTIPYNEPDPAANCWTPELNAWGDAAINALRNQGVSLGSFTHFSFVFPNSLAACRFGGYAENQGSRTYMNYVNPSIFAHEFGHNFGSHHASTLNCGNLAIANYGNCTALEYGDPYDIMGNIINLNHFNGAHKYEVGWLNPTETQTISSSGTYSLGPLEINSSSPKVLKIAKANTSEFYYLSYRQPLGFDATLAINSVVSGISIHIWDGSYTPTKFIDTTPNTNGNFEDASLSDGAIFNDSANNITIKQLGHNASLATVEVSFGPITPTPTPTPSPSPTPSPTPTPYINPCSNRLISRSGPQPTSSGFNMGYSIGTSALVPNNYLHSATFTKLSNATVTFNGQPVGVGATIRFSNGTRNFNYSASRINSGPITVELTLEDDCGIFPTFEGIGN